MERFDSFFSQSFARIDLRDAHNVSKDSAKIDIKVFLLDFMDCLDLNINLINF